ncbi:MAG: ABC transporter permease [Candidatus Nanopelagicales bacterium]
MLQTALKGTLAHKARLALTSVAILLGVAFVSGTFVFTDTIQARFDSLFADVYAGVDASVRAEGPEFGGDVTTAPAALPQSLVSDVAAVDGVAAAEGYVQAFGQVIADGEPVGGQGPPTYVYSWIQDPQLNPFRIGAGDGRAPQADGEVVVDVATAQAASLALGDRIDLQFATGAESFELVGIASFGDANNLAGATISVITLDDAQRILDLPGQVTFIDVAGAEGTDLAALANRIATVLPAGAEVVTGDQLMAEAIDGFTEGLGFLSTALLAFAAVAVLVGAFIIYNTFRIIVAQRTRELALLRAVGASARQVVGVVLAEALAVALLASAAGVVAGVGFAQLLKAGMDAVGFGPPDGPLTIEPRTVVVGMLVGVVVTLLSALVPALHASRVPPVAAMQQTGVTHSEKPVRSWLRVAVLAAGLVVAMAGLAVEQGALIALGCVLTVVGVLALAPLLARPIAAVVGRPIPGAVGQLARENAGRDPRRTSATASALTVGIALVVFTAIFASSTKDSIAASVEDAFPADLMVSSSNFYLGVSPQAQAAVVATPEVEVTSPLRVGAVRVDGVETAMTSFESSTIDRVYDAGSTIPLSQAGDGLLVHQALVDDGRVAVGDVLTVESPTGASAELTVVGSYRDGTLDSYAVDQSVWTRLGGTDDAATVLVGLREGVDLETGKAAVESALSSFPSLTVATVSEQIASVVAQVDAFLVLFTALLGMALLIAVLGIANTLALSIVERTREIGLLRAVGMSRRQVRWMITSEAVVTALFGAVVGSVLGLGLGWVVVTALSADGLTAFSLPVAQIATWLVVSALAGVVAAGLPARKAARLDVLRAIAYE